MKADVDDVALEDELDSDLVLEGTLVCALTGEHKTSSPQEETLQSFIEQLHREYAVDLSDMERDVRVECITGEEGGKARKKTRNVQLAVYEHGQAPRGTKHNSCSARCEARHEGGPKSHRLARRGPRRYRPGTRSSLRSLDKRS